MNRGRDTSGSAAVTAGLKRSVWPVATMAPRATAAESSRSASATDAASGFSTRTAAPDSTNGSATATCDTVGVAIETPSTRPTSSEASV